MTYELFLRGKSLDEQQMQSIRERVAQDRRLTIEPFCNDDFTPHPRAGFDLIVDMDEPAVGELLCEVAFGLAEDFALSVYDPQLGCTVAADAKQEIIDRLQQTASFMEGVGLGPPGTTAVSIARGKLWIYVAAAAMGLLLLGRLLTCTAI